MSKNRYRKWTQRGRQKTGGNNETDVRGPAPRIYLPKLLNWIRFDTAEEIREDHPEIWEKIYMPTSFSDKVFSSGVRPHFSQPGLYHHHFQLITQQLGRLDSLTGRQEKVDMLISWIAQANQLYSELQSAGVLFVDNNCKGEHLGVWNRILRKLKL